MLIFDGHFWSLVSSTKGGTDEIYNYAISEFKFIGSIAAEVLSLLDRHLKPGKLHL